MPKKIIARFEIPYLQILDENGKVDRELEPKLSDKQLLEMYRYMVLARVFDSKCIKLQRQGRMGTYPPLLGQEAAQIGSAYALEKEDWMFPIYRDMGQYIVRGLPMWQLMLYWMGNELGMQIPKDQNNFTLNIVVGSLVPHAVGAAYALKYLKRKAAVIVYFGDGATSEGEFYEGLNLAGVLKVPLVLFCENNQYAISVPRRWQSSAETLAQKAIAAGIEGIQVDGNDVLAVYSATKEALEKARAGFGPVFIEAYTYRLEMHTTADDPTRYRTQEEVEFWKKRDPLKRFNLYLKSKGIWDDEKEKALLDECDKLVEENVAKAESFEKPKPEEIFNYVYSKLTPRLKEQLEHLKKFAK